MKNKLPVLFCYYGGKFRIRDWIISHFPAHTNYIEPFGGSAAVMLGKPLSNFEVYNDLNHYIINVFRYIREPKYRVKIEKWLSQMPYSKEEFIYYRDHKDKFIGAKQAAIVLYLYWSSFAGDGRSWGSALKYRSLAEKKINKNKLINKIGKRFECVQIDNDDAIKCLQKYDNKDALFYCDPPYLNANISAYKHNLEHEVFLQTVLNLQGMCIISGYHDDSYNLLIEKGWVLKTMETYCSSSKPKDTNGKRETRTECLWLSPAVIKKLEQERLQKELF